MKNHRRPPRTPAAPKPRKLRGRRSNIWQDKAPGTACIKCGSGPLRYGNKSGLCLDCRNPLPFALKSGPIRLDDAMRRHCQDVLDHLAEGDRADAARMLGITAAQLARHLAPSVPA